MSNKAPKQLTEQQRRRFLEIRRRGRGRYIRDYGIVRFGSLWATLMAGLWCLVTSGSYPPLGPRGPTPFFAWLVYMIPFGILAGWVYGWWMWRIFERNTRAMVEDSSDGAPA